MSSAWRAADALRHLFGGGFEHRGGALEQVQALALPAFGGGAGEGFDAAYACADTTVADDLEVADEAGGGGMDAAAELFAEAVVDVGGGVADFDNADIGGVLLAEDGHCAGLQRLLVGHFVGVDGDVVADAGGDEFLHGGELAGGGSVGLGVVEPQPFGRDERAGLMDVVAEDAAQGGVEEMGGGVVAHEAVAPVEGDAGLNGFADGDATRGDDADVAVEVAALLRVGDANLAIREDERSGVALLAAALGVEGRSGEDDFDFGVGLGAVDAQAAGDEGDDAALGFDGVVAEELGAAADGGEEGVGGVAFEVGGGLGASALLRHGVIEALLIEAEAGGLGNLAGELHGEAVGVVEDEGFFADDGVGRELLPGDEGGDVVVRECGGFGDELVDGLDGETTGEVGEGAIAELAEVAELVAEGEAPIADDGLKGVGARADGGDALAEGLGGGGEDAFEGDRLLFEQGVAGLQGAAEALFFLGEDVVDEGGLVAHLG